MIAELESIIICIIYGALFTCLIETFRASCDNGCKMYYRRKRIDTDDADVTKKFVFFILTVIIRSTTAETRHNGVQENEKGLKGVKHNVELEHHFPSSVPFYFSSAPIVFFPRGVFAVK